ERMVMTPLFSPLATMASSSGRLRSCRLPTSAMEPCSRRGDLVLTRLLRGVEGDVGRFEQLACGRSRLWERGHADAHRDRTRVDEGKRPRLHGHLHALREHAC